MPPSENVPISCQFLTKGLKDIVNWRRRRVRQADSVEARAAPGVGIPIHHAYCLPPIAALADQVFPLTYIARDHSPADTVSAYG